MGRIGKCDWCGERNTKETEEFDHLEPSRAPNVCWRCGVSVPHVRAQIAKEIENGSPRIGQDLDGNQFENGTDYPEYSDGWCNALDVAIAIARGKK